MKKQLTFEAEGFAGSDNEELHSLKVQRDKLTAEIEDLEAQLRSAKDNLQHIEWTLLPAFMDERGLTSMTFSDGTKLEMQSVFSGKATPEALHWLEQNNCEGIIKDELVLRFSKGEKELADRVDQVVREMGFAPQRKSTIHPSTLKAFIREQCEENSDFPRDIFNVYEGRRAVFK
jgi:hypothetical protein